MTGACHACGTLLIPSRWGELCACGLGRQRQFVGDYELFQRLGEGAMGVVFMAKHRASDEVVALKLAKPDLLEHRLGAALFRQQAKTERDLKHPHIVPVQGSGEHQGQPFLVMPLMEGGTLAEPDNHARFVDAAARLNLMHSLARALKFAHERGVLHCDLKPENILFDAAGEPRVGDFGLARPLGASGVADVGEVRGGTPGWMSPEQANGEPLTTASDVFALGRLLQWLAAPQADVTARDADVFGEPDPAAPRSWSPELDWALDAIAWRATRPEPSARYGSAGALAEDLERVRNKLAPRGTPTPPWGRLWYWAQRHPGARNASFVLMPVFAALMLSIAGAQRGELRRAALDMNAYAASGQAAAVLYQLREYADAIERAAADPAVQALAHGPRRVPTPASNPGDTEPCRTQNALEDPRPLQPHVGKFSTIFVLDALGCARARISDEGSLPDYVQRTFNWRDYFSSAQPESGRPLRETYVRKSYRSSLSQLIKFAVSTPLFEDGKWVGVVTGSMVAAATLDLPRMKRRKTQAQTTVLLGSFEGERLTAGDLPARSQAEYTFLAHPALARGQKVTLPARLATDLKAAFAPESPEARQFELRAALPLEREHYVDPLLGDHWLAAFAPVGGTGYVVLVQSRDEVAIRPSLGIWRTAIAFALASTTLLVLYGCFWVWRWRREQRR